MSATLSIPSPLKEACKTTLFYYRAQDRFPPICLPPGVSSSSLIQMHPAALSVATVCSFYLCRVSEVLQLSTSDIISCDRVFCRGKKSGSSYILFLPGLSDQVDPLLPVDHPFPLFSVSYSVCYRSFVKAGIRFRHNGRKNHMRTHAFRYSAPQFLGSTLSTVESGDLLHHKSKSSISYYLK